MLIGLTFVNMEPSYASTNVLTRTGNLFYMNGSPIKLWGIRTASASQTDTFKNNLIAKYGGAFSIYVSDGYIYTVSNEAVASATNVTAPRVVSIVKLIDESHIDMSSWVKYSVVLPSNQSTTARFNDIYVEDGYAYISVDEGTVYTPSNNGIIVLDVKNKANIIQYWCQSATSNRKVMRIDKIGNIIFGASSGNTDLLVFDVSNPAIPVTLPSMTAASGCKSDIVATSSAVFQVNGTTSIAKIPVTSYNDVVFTSPFSSKITISSYTISGTSTAGTTSILLTVGLATAVRVTPDASGSWSYPVTGAANGDYIITAKISTNPTVTSTRTATVELVGAPGVITIGDPEFSVPNVANGDITATMTVTNPIDAVSTQNVTLIIALYYDGALIQADADSITVQKTGLATNFSATVTIPQTLPTGYTLNKYSVIAFVCDDFISVNALKVPIALTPASL